MPTPMSIDQLQIDSLINSDMGKAGWPTANANTIISLVTDPVSPSGTSASGEAARPKTTKAVPPPKGGSASKTVPAAGAMPHGNPEDGTLKYDPPPAQNPPAKKDAAH